MYRFRVDFEIHEEDVCGTRSSMLAGLSCTKGVWYIYYRDTGSSILIWRRTAYGLCLFLHSLMVKELSQPSTRCHDQVLVC